MTREETKTALWSALGDYLKWSESEQDKMLSELIHEANNCFDSELIELLKRLGEPA